MQDKNPEIESQLNELAKLCCHALDGGDYEIHSRSDPLLTSLLMSGFGRNSGAPLHVELESRILSECPKNSIHRKAAIAGITGKLQSRFDELSTWTANHPQDKSPPKPANISSATQA